MTSFDKRRIEFGSRLRRLREETGMTGRKFAEALTWPPSKISKLETGSQTATDSDVDEWCRMAKAPESVREDLQDALLDLLVEYQTWRKQLRGGYRQRQDESASLEHGAKVLRAVDFGAVPGLVQIPEYAREVFRLHAELQGLERNIEDAVAARMARQQVLYIPGKRIEILVAEAALRHPVVGPEVMRAQLDRLSALVGLVTVRFGVLPLNKRMPWMPMHGYWIIDGLVLIENISAEIRITSPEEVAIYNRLTDRLWEAAAVDNAARALISRVVEDLQD